MVGHMGSSCNTVAFCVVRCVGDIGVVLRYCVPNFGKGPLVINNVVSVELKKR